MAEPDRAGAWRVCPDVSFEIADGGMIASNHRARRHVWVSPGLLGLLIGSGGGPLAAANLTDFSCRDGLLADPTGRARQDAAEKVAFQSGDDAIDYLKKHLIVVDDTEAYGDYFAEKTSILDQRHFGTFHQQLGAELRLRMRADPHAWWYAQKFDPQTDELKDTAYKFVQKSFQDRYFETLDLRGKTVIDFGCGNGMASARFVKMGAAVIGIDPNPDLLAKAKALIGEGFTAVHMDLTAPDPLAAIPDSPVDFVWMADVFMFYFHPIEGGKSPIPPGALLRRLTRNLNPEGLCVVMQPHGVFWLLPWLGDADQPYTVITEYASRLFSVAPSLADLADAYADAGLAIKRIFEPLAAGDAPADARAYNFARNFPLWWTFECCKLPHHRP